MDPTTWNLPFLLVWLIMYGIILCRAGATYALGRLGRGGLAKSPRVRAMLASEKYARAEARVNRFGAPVVAASFLTIGFQTLANLAAGTTLMPWPRYIAALLVGGAGWATVYSLVGFAGFRAIGLAYDHAPVFTVGIAVAAAVILVLAIAWPAKRRKGTRGTVQTDDRHPLV
ncbi:DedA family protein [Brevibacterium jeotgali]|uniref:Membrane protein DedA, SNARE-associated domain n=1 Tax=Brevibacterium jeotgali TaxID=1262550 RepID=A0A2H1L6B4_9MICO|nr:VTT domain-containing protein [Brevibacterium jeotgali]TWB99042.1 membrane protein DedA with SNARE-associated domain [Brevibacterium jeotgali]SMY12451.1 membrane protein DedA, SNARE-associated domain [Brevibacterium jeotgali]